MCGRFTLATHGNADLADRFRFEFGGPSKDAVEGGTERFNVAPTQEILVVRAKSDEQAAAEGGRQAQLMRWGLVPHWAKDLKVSYKMINARSEGLPESRAYKPLVEMPRNRCLIIADGFYEWMKSEDKKQPRQPWRFTVDGGAPFAFAGLCTRRMWEDEFLYSCTIITTAANPLVSKVHDRMPAILPSQEAERAWLGVDVEADEALALLEPLDPRRMSATPANPSVNKVGGTAEGPEMFVAPE